MAHRKTFLNGDTTLSDKLIRERLSNDTSKIYSAETPLELARQVKRLLPFWCDNCLGHTPHGEALLLCIRDRAVEVREQYGGHDVPESPGPEADTYAIRDWATSVEQALKDHIVYVDEKTKQVVWDADNPGYITLKDAVERSGALYDIRSFGKKLRKPTNVIKWMNLRQRTKVNRLDFESELRRLEDTEKASERLSSQQGREFANQLE